MDCRFEDNELVAQDSEGNVVRVGVDEWEERGTGTEETEAKQYEVRHGTVKQLSLPPVNVVVLDSSGNRIGDHTNVTSSSTYGSPVQFRVDADIQTRLWVSQSADRAVTVRSGADEVSVTASGTLDCWIGFERPVDQPTIRVEKSVLGLAEALSAVHRTSTTFSPRRTAPNAQTTPARVEWDETGHVPDSLAHEADPTVIFRLPRDLSEIAVAVPLIYYLGGVLSLTPGASPALSLDGETYSVGRDATYSSREVFVLTFLLDRLLRCQLSEEPRVPAVSVLDELGLDPDVLIDLPIHRRAARYLELEAQPSEILQSFPEWHLSLSVEPTLENIRSIVPMLERWPVVTVASHDGPPGPKKQCWVDDVEPTVDEVEPTSVVGRTHGWIAPGVPTEGFKLLPGAIAPATVDSKRSHPEKANLEIRVVSCLDESSGDETGVAPAELLNRIDFSASEPGAVRAAYAERDEELEINFEHVENPTAERLAELFESSLDLLHFVGHGRADSGLQCRDETYFSPTTVSTSGVTTFFLNACETYETGRELIERGSTAGVVTGDEGISPSAATVGSNWSRLVARGWPVVTALDRATATIARNNHFVVGDGTKVVTQSDAALPPTVDITLPEHPGDTYRVQITHDQPFAPGGAVQGTFDEQYHVVGRTVSHEVDAEKIRRWLDETLDSPVLVDGELHWPTDRDWLD